jgi:hypothetical protein
MSKLRDRLKKLAYTPVGHDAPTAFQQYPDQKYRNQWDTVSPLNILFCDKMNNIVTMTPEDAKNYIIDNLENINEYFKWDDSKTVNPDTGKKGTFGTYSQEQINQMKYDMKDM